MTNTNFIQLSNMHNFGIGAPFRPIHLPMPSFVHVTEYYSIRYWYLFENIFDTMMRSFKNSILPCLVGYVGYVVKRLSTNCKLEHNVWVARSVGKFIMAKLKLSHLSHGMAES